MDNRFLKNVSNYSCLNDLMIASDLLISDYSSIFFDYSIMEKPMICFAYDYNEYAQNRGMYFDIRKKLASVTNQNDLVRLIKELPSEQNKDQVISFKKEFVEEYGHAVEKTVDFIYDNIRR